MYVCTTSDIYKISTCRLRSPRGQAPWGEEHLVLISYISGVKLMHILDVILMHILDVRIRMQISNVLLLLLATTVLAPLFWGFQPQSNNVFGSVVVPKTTVVSLTTVLKHNNVYIYVQTTHWQSCSFLMELISKAAAG